MKEKDYYIIYVKNWRIKKLILTLHGSPARLPSN